MALIKSSVLILVLLLLSETVFSQEPVLVAAEIQSIERRLADSRLPPAERKKALSNMARLFELSGNIEGAAEAWNEAAKAVPGVPDHNALLRSSLCLAAIGEFERAATALRPALASQDRHIADTARYVSAQIESLKAGKTDALQSLAVNPDFVEYRSGIYYSIWKISGDTAARNRLVAEFPQSPEARIARDAALDSAPVSAAPTAMWLLAPAGTGFSIAQPSQQGSQPPQSQRPNPVTAPSAVTSAAGGPVMLQTGLFSREENAQALAERLRRAGFSPLVSKKNVNGADHWAVGVPPGADSARTLLLLKDQGFESFPVY